jgi:hypothetical protein
MDLLNLETGLVGIYASLSIKLEKPQLNSKLSADDNNHFSNHRAGASFPLSKIFLPRGAMRRP